MTPWADHLVIAPVVLPLVAGALMLLFDERHRTARATINVVSTFGLVAIAVALLRVAEAAPRPASSSPVRCLSLVVWKGRTG